MIEVVNVNKNYMVGGEEVKALKNVSFKIMEGEFVAIIGPSGSGKSTLMNILGCLDIPDSGEYYIEQKNIAKLNDNNLAELRNRKIGFVFQNFNLMPRLSALENVELPLIYKGITKKVRKEKVNKALEIVGLSDRQHHKPSELSGGQQQRIAIARAIICDPEIILADEPTGNLDSKAGKDILNILAELNSRGKTVIIITHDTEIAKHAKRILKIYDGELIEQKYA
jgi:ABC-type antimicrobial peptide transport system, ATPase component